MGNKTEDKTMRQDILRAKTRPVEFHWEGDGGGGVEPHMCFIKSDTISLGGVKKWSGRRLGYTAFQRGNKIG